MRTILKVFFFLSIFFFESFFSLIHSIGGGGEGGRQNVTYINYKHTHTQNMGNKNRLSKKKICSYICFLYLIF